MAALGILLKISSGRPKVSRIFSLYVHTTLGGVQVKLHSRTVRECSRISQLLNMPVEFAVHASASVPQAVTVVSSLVATCNGATVIAQSRYFTLHRAENTLTDGTVRKHTCSRTADYTKQFNSHVSTSQHSKRIIALCSTFTALVKSNMEMPACYSCRQRGRSICLH